MGWSFITMACGAGSRLMSLSVILHVAHHGFDVYIHTPIPYQFLELLRIVLHFFEQMQVSNRLGAYVSGQFPPVPSVHHLNPSWSPFVLCSLHCSTHLLCWFQH